MTTGIEAQLLRQFKARDVEQAAGYLEGGHVIRLSVGRDGATVTALVQGGRADPYRCYVRLYGAGTNRTIDGECTCPQGYNCKHVAAALLQWDCGAAPVTAADSRVGSHPAGDADDYPAGMDERILYLLSIRHAQTVDEVCLRTVVCREIKAGGYGAPRPFSAGAALHAHPASFVLRRDLALIQGMVALPEAGAAGYSLRGEAGLGLLRSALATARCHWLSPHNPPLEEAAARHTDWRWRLDADGVQRFVPVGVGPSLTSLPLAAAWFVDAEASRCGPLCGAHGQTVPVALLAAAECSPQQSRRVAQDLRNRIDPKLWPLPRAVAMASPPVEPRPCLHLDSAVPPSANGGDSHPRDRAELRFDYLGSSIRPQDKQEHLLVSDSPPPTVSARNTAMETAAMSRLREAGLEPADPLLAAVGKAADCWSHPLGEHGWFDFVERSLPSLQRSGWRVEIAPRFRFSAREPGPVQVDVTADGDWFDLSLAVDVDGETVSVLPLLAGMARGQGKLGWQETSSAGGFLIAELDDGSLLRLPADKVHAIMKVLVELYGATLIGGHALRLPRFACGRLAELELELGEGIAIWRGAEELKQLGRRLQFFDGLRELPQPPGLNTQLRAYQRRGLDWLQFVREFGLGAILADDMGLGKTVQTIAHLLVEYAAGRLDRPALIIAPTSVTGNWAREIRRFAPDLRLVLLSGAGRAKLFAQIRRVHVVITSYALLTRDADTLLSHDYHLVVLDEAQTIKNAATQKARLARMLNARHRLCLTGTPMENHLGELWSQFEFLLPGYLGDRRQFARVFRRPVERDGNELRRQALVRRIAPFLLRRTKQEVAPELPAKTEIEQIVALHGGQLELYENIRLAMQRRVQALLQDKGLQKGRIEILDAILKLRQACCDPRLVKLSQAAGVTESAKLTLLLEMVPELVEEGRRILIFSQFTSMLSLIEQALEDAGVGWIKLTGQTRHRDRVIERFQTGAVPVFLLSLKAGGVGINLTAADTVIHYDPWWNPAAEEQATDRAHRIGQDKPVFVYRLLVQDSVETRIQALKDSKRHLADAVYGKGSGIGFDWTEQNLDLLFQPMDIVE